MPAPGRTLLALQNTEAEFLGLIEDHLEGRGIGFRYVRPATGSRFVIPAEAGTDDALIVLGGGPMGAVSAPVLPGLDREVALASDFLAKGRPVIGIGLGAQVLAIAAGGGADPGPWQLRVAEARRTRIDALNGFLPERFPVVTYMRDWPRPPADATVLAAFDDGAPALFQVGANAFGFAGHPGAKPGILEDLLMEFGDAPDDFAARLEDAKRAQAAVADALVPIMTGVIQLTGLMRPVDAAERSRAETGAKTPGGCGR